MMYVNLRHKILSNQKLVCRALFDNASTLILEFFNQDSLLFSKLSFLFYPLFTIDILDKGY
jgi:hypothetical protein